MIFYGIYFIMFVISAVCFAFGIYFIIKGARNVNNKHQTHNNWSEINAEIIDRIHFDTPKFSGIYDDVGHYEEVKIRYVFNGKEYVKYCADMNFEDNVKIFVKNDNPEEFRICDDDNINSSQENEQSEISTYIFLGIGICIGAFIIFAFFLKSFTALCI